MTIGRCGRSSRTPVAVQCLPIPLIAEVATGCAGRRSRRPVVAGPAGVDRPREALTKARHLIDGASFGRPAVGPVGVRTSWRGRQVQGSIGLGRIIFGLTSSAFLGVHHEDRPLTPYRYRRSLDGCRFSGFGAGHRGPHDALTPGDQVGTGPALHPTWSGGSRALWRPEQGWIVCDAVEISEGL